MRSDGSDEEKNNMHRWRLGDAAWSLATELHNVFPSHWGLHFLSCVAHNKCVCVYDESDFGIKYLHGILHSTQQHIQSY